MRNQQQIPKVLFISNDASLTGAPILLLHFLQLIQEKDLWKAYILLHRGGPLEEKFKAMGETIILKPDAYSKEKNIFKKASMKAGMFFKQWKLLFSSPQYDFVFNNTIANGSLIEIFHRKQIPVISYIHELENVLAYFSQKNETQKTFSYSNKFLIPSNIVRENLLHNHHISPEKIISLKYYFPGYEKEFSAEEKRIKTIEFLEAYKIPENKFLVFGMGTADLRKGFDYFIEICAMVSDKDASIHFVWLGDYTETNFENEMKNLIQQKKLEQNITVTGNIPFHQTNMLPAELFLMTSREDPYPLVVLEAAFAQVPSIAFNGAGGAAEFIEDDAGWLIDDFSLTTFAEKIIYLKNNPSTLVIAGTNARAKALSLHGDKLQTLKQLKNIETQILNI